MHSWPKPLALAYLPAVTTLLKPSGVEVNVLGERPTLQTA